MKACRSAATTFGFVGSAVISLMSLAVLPDAGPAAEKSPGPAAVSAPPSPQPADVPSTMIDAEQYSQRVKPFFVQHCFRCHGADKAEGKFRLDVLGTDFGRSDTDRHWIEVMDRINASEMPPEKEPRPDAEVARNVTRWIAAELRGGARRSLSTGGRVVLRRLNRTEYANTLRDLLGMTFLPGDSPAELLPPDGVAEGFDKVGKALMVDPSLLDKYYEVASRIAEQAIVSGPVPFPTYKKRYEFEDTIRNGAIKYICSHPGAICREHDLVLMEGAARSYGVFKYPNTNTMIPVRGLYTIRLRTSAFLGEPGKPLGIKVSRGDITVLETGVTAPPEAPEIFEVTLPCDPAGGGELNVLLTNRVQFMVTNEGYHQLDGISAKAAEDGDFARALRLRGRMVSEGLIAPGRPNPALVDTSQVPKLFLDWIELEGPLVDAWPPKSHQALFFKGEGATHDLAYAREIFTQFLPRGWRRPIDPAEVEPIVKLVKEELEHGGSFEQAIRSGLTAALTSPKFLYLNEPAGESPRPLTGHELASRLSYFLWSSMPDDALFKLAESGKLNDPQALQAQVDRMLADPKSKALVDGFAVQWLRTDEFRNFAPDKRLYQAYDAKLGEAMVQETLRFFDEVLRHDLSALNFIDSDWTMANERLAKFYGIPDVAGDGFRRVQFPPDAHRGGLLGQAGVMMRGSDGTRTKPVRRGVYVREVLFNDPPDPPPPNVGEIEPNVQGKNLTVRQRLLGHQQIASCAACHRTIDPYGLALENYDVIGSWRTQQTGERFPNGKVPDIDASGTLPNGKSFDGPEQFKKLLLEQQDRFARGLSEKMLVYALGRPMEPADRGTLDALVSQMAAQNYSLRGLLKGIVASDAFRIK